MRTGFLTQLLLHAAGKLTGLRVDVAVEVDVGVAQRAPRDRITAHTNGLDWTNLHTAKAAC